MKWRWDQGRLGYFQFDEIKLIAGVLASAEGLMLPRAGEPDSLRELLRRDTILPFAPEAYTVWRNYKRVFGCQMLATEKHRMLLTTDICRQLASQDVDADDYFISFANRFSYPSPVFDDYDTTSRRIYPVCAVIKLLLARHSPESSPSLSAEEVLAILKPSELDGTEPISAYAHLSEQPIDRDDGEIRQVRELLRFISQLSFLKWLNGRIYMDVLEQDEVSKILGALSPITPARNPGTSDELLSIGYRINAEGLGKITSSLAVSIADVEFTEGKKIRVTHLRAERSSKLRDIFFSAHPSPHNCDMCRVDTTIKYPWVNRLIELHHLLPLASPVRVESSSTSLKDLVGLCPSCHRATHKFYSKWMTENSAKDFTSYQQARDVYTMAKNEVSEA